MEHKPWVGHEYSTGVAGHRIMIVGNSHWLGENEPDTEEVSIQVVERVVSGDYNIAFFNQIRDYFGFISHSEFWSRAVFMNYAPKAIGEGHQRFDDLTRELADQGKVRFKKQILEYRPDLVFVFSTKIQWALPPLSPKPSGLPLSSIKVGALSEAADTKIYLLRHTQGAPKQLMTDSVQAILAAGR